MVKALSDPLHDLHRRRFGRNLGVGLSLAAVVAITFALTLVKIAREEPAASAVAPGQAPEEQGAQERGAQTPEAVP